MVTTSLKWSTSMLYPTAQALLHSTSLYLPSFGSNIPSAAEGRIAITGTPPLLLQHNRFTKHHSCLLRKVCNTACDERGECAGTGTLRFIDSSPPEWYMQDDDTEEDVYESPTGRKVSQQPTTGKSDNTETRCGPTPTGSGCSNAIRASTPGLGASRNKSPPSLLAQGSDGTDIWRELLKDPMFSNLGGFDA